MIDVIAAMDGTFPQRCFQSSSARAMGSNERLSGFGTVQTLPAGHMLVSSVSPFGHPRPDFRCLSDRSKEPADLGVSMGLYVETRVRAGLETLWERAQEPDRHQQWDLRFTEITH